MQRWFAGGWCLFVLIVSAGRAVGADPADAGALTIDRIFQSGDFDAQSFTAQWTRDGDAYLTLQPAAGGGREIVRHDALSGQTQVVVPAARLTPPGESTPLAIDAYAFSDDRSLLLIYTNSKRVWRANTRGDYWLLDLASHALRKLGGDAAPATLMFATLSPTGRHVAYARENNLYVEDCATGRITPLTTSGSDKITNGTFDWVYEEELGLRQGFAWSPDGEAIAYWQIDATGVPEYALVNTTDGLYPRITWIAYPKVGQQNSACRVGVVAASGGPTRWMDVPGDPREHYLARLAWTPDGRHVLIQQLNRRQNVNRLLLADADTGRTQPVLAEQDDRWVDVNDEFNWLKQGVRFTWISERDGWRHAYLGSLANGQLELITPGGYDVTRLLHVDEDARVVYFQASPDRPTQRFLYRVGLDGRDLRRLTPADQTGWHEYDISPNGLWAIHQRSTAASPPLVDLVDLPQHSSRRVLVDNAAMRKRFEALQITPPEFFRVSIEPDVTLDAWRLKPAQFDPAKKYPLLIYVYGEPAGQTVVDRWGGRNALWHWMLTQHGYVVMSFDNRGTPAPRGRAWRKAAFHQLGVIGPADQAAALKKVLGDQPYLDPQRVAIWGWSGGGSSSLHAIFKYPQLYHTAMAVAAVPNRRYYDTIYEERYMGLPGDNPDGYLQSSPINFAHQLQGNLLIVHGTGDDNCHYQGAEALVNELVRLNKPFSMMAYPNRTHAISEGANTTRHLRELLTRYLLDNN